MSTVHALRIPGPKAQSRWLHEHTFGQERAMPPSDHRHLIAKMNVVASEPPMSQRGCENIEFRCNIYKSDLDRAAQTKYKLCLRVSINVGPHIRKSPQSTIPMQRQSLNNRVYPRLSGKSPSPYHLSKTPLQSSIPFTPINSRRTFSPSG